MVRGNPEEIMVKYPDYQFYICDYGVINTKNSFYMHSQIYESCNKYIVVAGVKPWEKEPDNQRPWGEPRKESREALWEEKLLFLANFADGKLFLQKCARLNKWGKWVRVPYVPDPFQVKETWIKELIDEILYEKGEDT